MSYDVTFLPKSAGATAEQVEAYLESYEGDSEPVQGWKQSAESAVTELEKLNADFERFESGSCIELSTRERAESFAVQISLFPGEAAISVPYWYTDNVGSLFQELWKYAQVITKNMNLIGYDGQTGVLWQTEKDALEGADLYAGQSRRLHG